MSLSLEEIRKKRMQEMQRNNVQDGMAQYQRQEQQMEQIRQELKSIMPQILDAAARERLSVIISTKPDFAMQVQLYLVSMYRQGQLTRPMNDNQFKAILDSMVKKPSWNIRRK